ncbi:uncharacterized protein [Montipora capricornis]|uniref:uncharacterized protein n=1 Tax=Montipora capricornis TaxID=246305 RepID=UPI0035F17D12
MVEEESTLDGPRPQRNPKPSKKKLAALEDTDGNADEKQELVVSQRQENMKRKADVESTDEEIVSGKEEMESQKQKRKKSRKQERKSNVTEVASGQEQTVSQKKKSNRKAVVNDENEIVAVANAKRVQNLLTRRQHVTVSDEDNLVTTEIIEVEDEGEESGSEETSDLAQKKRFVQNLPTSPQSSDKDFSSPQHHQSLGATNSSPLLHQASGSNFHSPQQAPQLSRGNFNSPEYQQPPQYSVGNFNSHQHQHSPQFSGGNFNSPQHQAPAVANSSTPLHCGNFSSPQQPHNYLSSDKRHSAALQASDSKYTYGLPYQPQATTLRPSALPHCDQATPKRGFSFFESLQHCSDFDVSDLDLPMNPTSHVEARSHITRDGTQQSEALFNNLHTACSSCQPLLMSLHKRLSSLEAEFEKLKRKQRKGKTVLENEVAGKENPNEERFNGITKEALGKSIDDSSDIKTAVETLAKQLFTSNELKTSSVTGFQCNKDYEARPGLSPSRRSLLESMVLKKGFPGASRSSVRKDLGLVLKKARANNKENNKPRCKNGQEHRQL